MVLALPNGMRAVGLSVMVTARFCSFSALFSSARRSRAQAMGSAHPSRSFISSRLPSLSTIVEEVPPPAFLNDLAMFRIVDFFVLISCKYMSNRFKIAHYSTKVIKKNDLQPFCTKV